MLNAFIFGAIPVLVIAGIAKLGQILKNYNER